MSEGRQRQQVRRLLETNRNWAAYALADLDPRYDQDARWILRGGAVVLLYEGLTPPVLFALGDPQGAREAFAQLPEGPVQFTLKEVHRSLLGEGLIPEKETRMWRMVLHPDEFPGQRGQGVEPLGPAALAEVEDLMGNLPDRPDSFSQVQLETGTFFGLRQKGRLVAMAGTHVLSEAEDVAAIGNVFTHPDHRNRGYGRAVSAAVTASLLDRGFGTIVLNVAMDNEPALHLYRDLGFWPFCGYYEGVGRLQPSAASPPAGGN